MSQNLKVVRDYHRNVYCTPGDTFTVPVKFSRTDGEPVDVSGNTFYGWLRRNEADPEPEVEFRVDLLDAANGVARFRLDPAVTNSIEQRAWVYKMEMNDGETIYTLGYGWFHLGLGSASA
jgi:hypothetical protein